MLDQIKAAIFSKQLITFRYDNENRLVEPHALGYTSKGKLALRGYQPAGGTSRELGWKLFTADKCENLQVLELTFERPRDGYKLGDKQIPGMIAQLDAAA